MTRTVVVLQPGYLPWLGFFDQMRRSDVFIYYDDVQFDKHGWRNRNRIKTPAGPMWLTVPVLHTGLGRPPIVDTLIDSTSAWSRKHVRSLRQNYARPPFLNRYLPELEELLERPWTHIAALDMAVVDLSGDAAQAYLDLELFAAHGVTVEWQQYRHPVYAQQHGEFVPLLSAIDLLLNCGDESADILKQGTSE